jgi:hypothetical protein
MNLTPEMQRRIAIFGAGALIGTVFAIALFQWATTNEVTVIPDREVTVVMSTCDLKAGDTLTADCVEERTVKSRLAPPQTLMAADLDWHVGRKLDVAVPKGSAFRMVDFEPRKDGEGSQPATSADDAGDDAGDHAGSAGMRDAAQADPE